MSPLFMLITSHGQIFLLTRFVLVLSIFSIPPSLSLQYLLLTLITTHPLVPDSPLSWTLHTIMFYSAIFLRVTDIIRISEYFDLLLTAKDRHSMAAPTIVETLKLQCGAGCLLYHSTEGGQPNMNVLCLRRRLQKLSHRRGPVKTFVLVVGEFSAKIDLLDLSLEGEALIGR